MYRKQIIVWLTLFIMALAACGDDEEQPVVLGKPTQNEIQSTATSTEPSGDLLAAGGDLLLMQGKGGRLVRPAKAETLETVIEGVQPASVWPIPDGRGLLYSPTPVRGQPINISYLELPSQEVSPLLDIKSPQWIVDSWSPSLDAAVIAADAYYYVNFTTKTSERIADVTTMAVIWLVDGRIATLDRDQFAFDQNARTYASDMVTLALFDPQSHTSTEIEIPVDSQTPLAVNYINGLLSTAQLERAASPYSMQFDYLETNAYLSADVQYYATSPEDQGRAPSACGPWEIKRREYPSDGSDVVETLVVIEDVYRLTELQALADGRLLFLAWRMPDCNMTDIPQVSLLELTPGAAEPRTLIENSIFPGLSISDWGQRFYGVQPRYALSPDETYIAWLSGDLATVQTALHITHLASGTTETLIQLSGQDSTTDDFITQMAITGVYWLE
ncbi:MAG TPA: hypothetical protein VHP83_24630 [Aggregatilineaceae bacterium]|nr:hypothetical protein [Aggregatilineaceae bacterium]